jgi:hypothetical protein
VQIFERKYDHIWEQWPIQKRETRNLYFFEQLTPIIIVDKGIAIKTRYLEKLCIFGENSPGKQNAIMLQRIIEDKTGK